MIKIYHNPRCSKSRLGVAYLEEQNVAFEIIKYLDAPLTTDQLTAIIDTLNIEPIALVRKNEKIWKEEFKGKLLSDSEIIDAMVNNPKLIERPIVINNTQGVIGRPTENISKIVYKK